MDLTLIMATIILVVIIYRFLRQDPRYPPCPSFPLPFVGHLFILKEDSRVQYKQWRQQLGDLFSIFIGGHMMVVVSGYHTLKEVFVKNGDDCLGRPSMFLDEATGLPKKGIIMSDGQAWREQRSVTMSILRNFGMGKNILAEKIQEEAKCYMDVLSDLRGKPTDIRVITNISMSNIICSVMIGQRFQYDDAVFQDLMNTLNDIVADFGVSNYASFIPALKYLPGDLLKIKKLHSSVRKVMDIFVNKFVQAKSNEKLEDEASDNFIAAYLREWKQKATSDERTTMNEENLSKIIWDLFNAGTETAATTILWCLLYSLNYPDVQDKIYAEIEAEIGTEKLPSIQDKPKLVYLNAFIMESQRLASIAALSVPHECTSEISVGGYIIPKGTLLIPNMDSVSYDKQIWGEDVDILRPERFIDENGKLKNPEEFIPFGIGKRACPGEGWAKTVIFLYLSAMFQIFKFLPPNPESPPPADYVFGLDVCPVPYEVRIVNRK